MTANVLEHRRAKSFAEALEAHQAESRPSSPDRSGSTAMAELLAMTDALGAMPAPELSQDARTVQRAQLMAAFEQHFAGGEVVVSVPRQRRHRGAAQRAVRGRWGRRLAIGGLVAGVAVSSFAGAATASTNALPGDTLYGMKRSLEDLRLDWAGSDAERGTLLLGQARTRLDEAEGLLGRANAPDQLSPNTVDQVRRALDDMSAEALRGKDLLHSVYRDSGSLTPIQTLASFANGQDDRWQSVQKQLPPQLTTQASKVDQIFTDLKDEDATELHQQPSSHSGGGSQEAPASDGPAQGQQPGTGSSANQRGTNGSPASGGNQAPSNAPVGVGGLVSGLTSGLTGNGQAGPTPTPGPGDKSGANNGPSAGTSTTPDSQGISIPPLIPGLLPGLSLK